MLKFLKGWPDILSGERSDLSMGPEPSPHFPDVAIMATFSLLHLSSEDDLISKDHKIQVLMADPPYIEFYQDKVVLQSTPMFLPSFVIEFHYSLQIHLSGFFPKSHSFRYEASVHITRHKESLVPLPAQD